MYNFNIKYKFLTIINFRKYLIINTFILNIRKIFYYLILLFLALEKIKKFRHCINPKNFIF